MDLVWGEKKSLVGWSFFKSFHSYFWSEDIATSTVFNVNKFLRLNDGDLSNSTL